MAVITRWFHAAEARRSGRNPARGSRTNTRPSIRPAARKTTTDTGAEPPSEAGWSYHDSTKDLLSGLDVLEYSAPPDAANLMERILAYRASLRRAARSGR